MKKLVFFLIQIFVFAVPALGDGLHCQLNTKGEAVPADDLGQLGQYYFHDIGSCRAAISQAAKGLICVSGTKVGYAQPFLLSQHKALGTEYYADVDSCVKAIQNYDGQFVCLAGEGTTAGLYDVIQDLYVDTDYKATLDACLQGRKALQPLQSRVKADGSIVLEATDCNLLNKQSDALINFNKRLGGVSGSGPACSCQDGNCSLRVDPIIPPLMQKMQNVNPDFDGPNCWNAALVFAQIVPSLRFTSEGEFGFWMNSPLCRELKDQEPPSPGDIIEIRSRNGAEIHGFLYLSSDLSFSKDGSRSESPYLLQSPGELFDIYNVLPQCRRVRGQKADCDYYANYFTCSPYADYVAKAKPAVSANFTQFQKQIDNLEAEVSELAMRGNHNLAQPFQLRDQLYLEIQSLSTAVNAAAQADRKEKNLWILWRSLTYRLSSFYEQLNQVK